MIAHEIDTIITNKIPCYFISPHFDDAAMSAGSLMSYLAQYTRVEVINIFTRSGIPPFTLAARSYIHQCGYTDAQILYADREAEDELTLKNIAHNITNFTHPDALWRKRTTDKKITYLEQMVPELIHLYPTYWLHIVRGNISPDDLEVITTIKQQLHSLVTTGVVFTPICIGNHVDHVITRTIVEHLSNPIIYWSDFPYNTRLNIWKEEDLSSYDQFTYSGDPVEKLHLLEGYKSQYAPMFGTKGATVKDEVYYMRQATAH